MSLSSLRLYSEPYGTTGNIGENFRKLLGAPSLDRLQTVVREAVQNIADAAHGAARTEILIRVRRLTNEQRDVFKRNVLEDLPPEDTSGTSLQAFLTRDAAVVLEICDFGTTGLAGPTRADRIPVGTNQTDFIDFLRNIGTPRDTTHGGGTYGFGKVALYQVSRCSSILVDTLIAEGDSGLRRVIGCHIGRSFEVPEDGMRRRYTGRHWWGVPDPMDGVVDPATGEAAQELSAALGFPPRGQGRTGTSIMILDFDPEGEDLVKVGYRIVEALLWNFWPRMMRGIPADRHFSCTVEVDGNALPIPCPEDVAPLDLFTKAMRAARQGSGNDVRSIFSKRPNKHLGHLALEKGLKSQRHPLIDDGSLIPPVSSHIALMRPVELVVKYLEGSPLPQEQLEWAGVFIASDEDEVERAFANSEPPAHDDWIPDNLPKGPAKTYVNVAMRSLKECALEMGNIGRAAPTVAASGTPLARIAGRLGAALEGVGGDGARSRPSGVGGRPPRPPRARASRPVFERLVSVAGNTLAIFSTEVRQDSRCSGAVLVAEAAIAMEGSAAGGIGEGIPQPKVVAIRSERGESAEGVNRVKLGGAEGRYEICVEMPPDCAVTVGASVLTEGDL